MIASSLKEGEALVDLLLSKDADVNTKSMSPMPHIYSDYTLLMDHQPQTIMGRSVYS